MNLTTYERYRRQRTLHVILLIIMLATFLLSVVNLYFYEAREPALVFFTAGLLCLPGLWLNRRSHFLLAGMLASGLVLAAAHYNLVDGAGLRDPGIAAYPILVVIGSLLFGKRAILFFTILSIASLTHVAYLESIGPTPTPFLSDIDNLIILSILMFVAAALVWAILDNSDKNIARLKQSEVALRVAYEETQAKEQKIRQIIQTVPVGVVLLNAQHQISLANEMAQAFLPLLVPQPHDISLQQLGPVPLSQILLSPEQGVWHDIILTEPEEKIFEVAGRLIPDNLAGQEWVLILHDVTLERKKQDSLQTQERLATVGQLAAGIAHDFRNILTVISTYSQILQARPDIPKRQKYLTVIQEQTKHAVKLIEQILDFSRRSMVERQPYDLIKLVDETVTLLRRVIPSSIAIHFDFEPGEYVIQADKTHFQQALMNLGVNARDAMPEGGVLRFALSHQLPSHERFPEGKIHPTASICLEISDTGSGIDPEDLSRIFDPFYTTKLAGKGTGLGLAQVYGIVKQHDGAIHVVSTLGKGTTFYLYFLTLVATVATNPTEALLLKDGTPRKILLVEDNTLTRQATIELLALLGHPVIAVSNGQEALTVFRQRASYFDLIISDIVMPEMGGIELFQALKKEVPHVKMLIMTGYPLEDKARTLLELGITAWIQKPCTIAELAEKIQEIS